MFLPDMFVHGVVGNGDTILLPVFGETLEMSSFAIFAEYFSILCEESLIFCDFERVFSILSFFLLQLFL